MEWELAFDGTFQACGSVWASSKRRVESMHAIILLRAVHRGVGSSSERRINCGIVEAVVLRVDRAGWRRGRSVTSRGGGVALRNLASVGGSRRRSGRGYGDLVRSRVGGRLDLRRAGLLLENWIVA